MNICKRVISVWVSACIIILFCWQNTVVYGKNHIPDGMLSKWEENEELRCDNKNIEDSTIVRVEEEGVLRNKEDLYQALENGSVLWIDTDKVQRGKNIIEFIEGKSNEKDIICDDVKTESIVLYLNGGYLEINYVLAVNMDDSDGTVQEIEEISDKEVVDISNDIINIINCENSQVKNSKEDISYQSDIFESNRKDYYKISQRYISYVKSNGSVVAEIEYRLYVDRKLSTSQYKVDDCMAAIRIYPKDGKAVKKFTVEMGVFSSCLEIIEETYLLSDVVVQEQFSTNIDMQLPQISAELGNVTTYMMDTKGLYIANEFGHDRYRKWRAQPISNGKDYCYSMSCGVRMLNKKVSLQSILSTTIILELSGDVRGSLSCTYTWK